MESTNSGARRVSPARIDNSIARSAGDNAIELSLPFALTPAGPRALEVVDNAHPRPTPWHDRRGVHEPRLTAS